MKMFEQAFSMFKPTARTEEADKPAASGGTRSGNDLDELRRQISEMQKRLDRLGDQDKD
jgi:polyhydroxyalkanoate synthesis regulator protein